MQIPDDDEDGAPLGQYLDVEPSYPELTETEDGGLIVTLGAPEEQPEPEEGGFYENLAEVLPDHILDRLATDLLRKIAEDKEARKKRDEQYEEGIRRTGLGNDAPGGAQFEGASKVVHPMLVEACIDFESRVIKEIWPAIGGPVKEKIVGQVTTEKTERAKRKVEYMNWQLETQIEEARTVVETTFTQVPLGGSQFIKLWQDHHLKRPRMQFIPVDKVYIPFSASDYWSAHRRTFADTISMIELRQRMESGMYRKLELGGSPQSPEPTKSEKATQKVEGVEDPGMNLDGDREVYEVMSLTEVTEDMASVLQHETAGELYPYLISIDETSKKVLSLYRDWEEDDPTKRPIQDLFEFPFIPWRGAYSIGFPQIIGSLSAAATGALRALLDTAFIENSAGGFVLKGAGVSGQTKRPNPTELVEIDRSLETDDIRKMVLPHSAMAKTSATLFQLLGFVVEAGKGVVRTSLDDTAVDSNANTPVGTQLSRVEQGMVVFSAIHARAHAAFNRLLSGLHRLNKLYLPDVIKVGINGKELLVRRSDFADASDIQPVSDPTIYSDQQRMVQITAIQQRATALPQLYNMRKVEERWLKLIKIPDPDELLADQPQPHELNAVNENLAMALGKPVVVFPEQDHLAHIKVLLDFMQSPLFGGNPLIAQAFLPNALRHAAEHMCYLYVHTTVETVEKAAKTSVGELMSRNSEVKRAFDGLLAQASGPVMQQVMQTVQGAMPILQQAMQTLQQMQPQPPVDPALAAVDAAKAETQRKAAADQHSAQFDLAKLGQDFKLGMAKVQQDANEMVQKLIAELQLAREGNQVKLSDTAADNQTALTIAGMRTSGPHPQQGHFTDGKSLERP